MCERFAELDLELGNVVGGMNKSLGGLVKNTRDILKQKRKKKRKKGTRKLLKKFY